MSKRMKVTKCKDGYLIEITKTISVIDKEDIKTIAEMNNIKPQFINIKGDPK